MSTTTLKFFIREDGHDFPICDMSEPECAAIGECVSDLVPSKYQFTSIWFEADTCILDDEDGNSIEEDDDYEEPSYGLLRCFRHNPNPRYFTSMESKLPTPIPQEVLDALAGKTFTISPPQYGLNAWGKKVEVIFADAPSAPAPTSSVPVVQAEKKNTTDDIPDDATITLTDKGVAYVQAARAMENAKKTGIKASDLIAMALATTSH